MAEEKIGFKILVVIISAIIGSALTFIVQPYVAKRVDRAKEPQLLREERETPLASLSPEVLEQVKYVPVSYKLSHIEGPAAKNITISVTSNHSLAVTDITFDKESEPRTVEAIDSTQLAVSIPTIRPNAFVSFALFVPKGTDMGFHERAEIGRITSGWGEADTSMGGFWAVLGVTLVGVTAVIAGASLVLGRAVRRLRRVESTGPDLSLSERNVVLACLIGVLVYNAAAAIPRGLILALPRVAPADLFYVTATYFVLTRLRAFDALIRSGTGSNP